MRGVGGAGASCDNREMITPRFLVYLLLGAMTSAPIRPPPVLLRCGAPLNDCTPLAKRPLTTTCPPLLELSALMRPAGYSTLPNLDLARDQAPIYSIRKPA